MAIVTLPIPPLSQKDIDRFWSKLDRSGGPNACWPYMEFRHRGEYGRINIKGKKYNAQRVAYRIVFGPIPKNKFICHICDNPPCCNPKHLYVGDVETNYRDSIIRGRRDPMKSSSPGEKNPRSKLTEDQVKEIRAKYKFGVYGCIRLGKEYDVDQQQIWNIVNYRSWNHIEP